jgi:histidine triad (HIT) family protein
MSDCLFCRIISGEIKGSIVYQDDDLVAIKDLNPQAPLHVLIMPRQHIATINDLRCANDALVGSMFRAAAALAKEHGYAERGRSSTATAKQASRSSTFTCICSQAGRWRGRRDNKFEGRSGKFEVLSGGAVVRAGDDNRSLRRIEDGACGGVDVLARHVCEQLRNPDVVVHPKIEEFHHLQKGGDADVGLEAARQRANQVLPRLG